MTRITEQSSLYNDLEQRSVEEITAMINREDQRVPLAIQAALPQLNALITEIVAKLKAGGRLFYVGAGSGGRLSVLDAIELPTTFGVPKGLVNVILAGGIDRLAEAPEEMEDLPEAGWYELMQNDVSEKDIVLGISASGTTPFVLGALSKCREHRIITGCIVSNPESPIAAVANFPVEVITGPEFLTGSTDMQAIINEELHVKAVVCASGEKLETELNTDLTDDLRAEGLMRDIVRHIQNLRKTSGLNVEDRIVLHIASDDAGVKQAVEKFGDVIQAETLATSMSGEHVGPETEIKVGDSSLTASLRKA